MRNYKDVILLVSELGLSAILALGMVYYIPGCALESNKKSEAPPIPEVSPIPPDQGGCGKTVFDRHVKTLLTDKCASCHPGFDTYATAKTKIDQFIARTSLADNEAGRMPKAPNTPLSQAEKDIFTSWKKDGLLESCPGDVNTNPYIDNPTLEIAALNDIQSLPSGSQSDIRWLSLVEKNDEGASLFELKQFELGVQKSINSMSLKRGLVLAKPVDSTRTLFRFSLNDLGLKPADWNFIEVNDPINFESNTSIGKILKDLTKTRKPILSVESFTATVTKAKVYYGLRRIGSEKKTLLSQLGVDDILQLDNFEALQVGFANSPISLNKNRLLARFDANNTSLWLTFDINEIAVAEKNLFKFPLLQGGSGKALFKSDASEAIFGLANGLHGYALFDAAGKRLDAAALDIVAHNVNPPADPTIKASSSCFRCHNGGFIPRGDEVKKSVNQGGVIFDLRDVDAVNQIYRDPAASFAADNAEYIAALTTLGISPIDKDPISIVLDSFQERNLNAKMVAAQFRLTEAEFTDCLSQSADGRGLIGTLLSGGTITFSQLIQAASVIIRDCRIGQDPL